MGQAAMTAYYNEIDPFAARSLRNLIAGGLIAPGDVDERSIEDVRPDDLRGYDQCHFFAGIGGWPLALRLAGWPDDRPVWTGSCPCQPFSKAGKRQGTADKRHLWPVMFGLVEACRPPVVFGEQVASSEVVGTELETAFVVAVRGGDYARANKLAKRLVASRSFHFHPRWIDGVRADLEAADYAVRFPVLGAHSVGAPHIRQRLFWVADTNGAGRFAGVDGASPMGHGRPPEPGRDAGGVADADGTGSLSGPLAAVHRGEDGPGARDGESQRQGAVGGVADAGSERLPSREPEILRGSGWRQEGGAVEQCGGPVVGGDHRPSPLDGFWRDADWLFCRDGKWRPVIPSHVEMVDGVSDTMVPVRSEREVNEKVSDHGTTSNSDAIEVLPPLSGATGAQDDQRETGRPHGVHAQDVLQSSVHGIGDGQGELHQPEPYTHESASPSKADVPDMRTDGKTSRPPQRREPFQQFAVEFDDVVSLLPPSLSLATHDGRRRDAEALRTLCESICAAGSVRYAPEQAQAVWASLSQEAKDRIRLGFDVRAWRRVVFSPLSVGEAARVGQLRAYGNAIVPQVAAQFIMAADQNIRDTRGQG